jgi:hypothetical protein
MFWTSRIHFALSPTDAGVHPAKRAMAVSTPHRRQDAVVCFRIPNSQSLSGVTRASEILMLVH